jgi:hypothetical protein
MDAGQKQQKRDPKCAQPKKPNQDARYMRTNDAEQIVNRAGYFGIVYRGIIRAEGQQTDQGKNDEKKAKYTDDLFTHKLVSGYGLRVTRCGLWGSGVRHLSVV